MLSALRSYKLCFFLLCGLCYCSSALLWGQRPSFNFRYIAAEYELPPSSRYFISSDSFGYLWLGTEMGLLRFDGQHVRKFQHQPAVANTLAENQLTSKCFSDEDGNLWFTTNNYLNCYRRATNDFISFQHQGSSGDYHAFQLIDGKVWLRIGLGDDGALWYFDLASKRFSSSVPLRGKRCFVLTAGKETPIAVLTTALPGKTGLSISNLTNGAITNVDFQYTTDGTKRTRPSTTSACYVDDSGIIYVGVQGGLGIYRLGQEKGLVAIQKADHLSTAIDLVWAIEPYDKRHLLVTAENGLYLFDKQSNQFTDKLKFDNPQAEQRTLGELNNLFRDPQGNYWLASNRQELIYLNFAKHRFPQLATNAKEGVSAMQLDPDGQIWCGMISGAVYAFSPDQERLFYTQDLENRAAGNTKFPMPQVHHFLHQSDGSWWANSYNYFLPFTKKKQAFHYIAAYELGAGTHQQVPSEIEVDYCLSRKKGEQLAIVDGQVYRLSLTLDGVSYLPWHNLAYLQLAEVILLFEDDLQRLFIADKTGRLVVIDDSQGQVKKVADLRNLGTLYALQADSVRQTIWLAGSKGLAFINPHTFAYTLLGPSKHKLPNETYYNVLADDKGRLWLPSNNGLIRYLPETRDFHRFTTTDGLLSGVFSKNTSLYLPQTGEIWLGSKNGINVFHPDSITLLDDLPPVHFSRFLVNDAAYDILDNKYTKDSIRNINLREKIRFPYIENTLSFEFTALDFSDPKSNEYYYQMIGLDQDSVLAGSNNFVRYPNLPPGNYTFKVWATNSDKQLNPKAKALQLTIVPPFHQTPLFYLICLLLITGIIYGIFQYRLRQALKVERLRVKISSDLHDDVGGMLSGLAMQTEILELTASPETKPKLSRIAELSRSAMSRMRDTVWAIDARKDKLENLIDRMREHAEETLTAVDIQYSINTSQLDLKKNLATDVRQSLYLIFKEAITNVAKHSNGDTVNVDLQKDEQGFTMSIHDNGIVAEKGYKSSGLGQSNMRMRAKAINASLTVDTTNGFHILLRRDKL